MDQAHSITWSSSNPPVKYQFSTSASGPWHDEMQTNDKYRRDSTDGGKNWGTPYQFKGTDGAKGDKGDKGISSYNDVIFYLNHAKEVSVSKFSMDSTETPRLYAGEIYAPNIYGNVINLMPLSYATNNKPDVKKDLNDLGLLDSGTPEFNIYGTYKNKDRVMILHYFQVTPSLNSLGAPITLIKTPNCNCIEFDGNVSFSGSMFQITKSATSFNSAEIEFDDSTISFYGCKISGLYATYA